jgi:hypothetical protein
MAYAMITTALDQKLRHRIQHDYGQVAPTHKADVHS